MIRQVSTCDRYRTSDQDAPIDDRAGWTGTEQRPVKSGSPCPGILSVKNVCSLQKTGPARVFHRRPEVEFAPPLEYPESCHGRPPEGLESDDDEWSDVRFAEWVGQANPTSTVFSVVECPR